MKQKVIYLEMFDFEKIEYPNILVSGGLWPCIAVGFYNNKTQSGYMLHEPCLHDSENLENILMLYRMMEIIYQI